MASKQIQIAQDDADAREMASWLERCAEVSALPAVFVGQERPLPFRDRLDARAAVFLESDRERVLKNCSPSPDDPNVVVAANSKNRGWIFQWSRTRLNEAGYYVPTGAGGSRLYYANECGQGSVKLKGLFDALVLWVQQHSPWISDERHPIYVGKSLGNRVLNCETKIVRPSGKVVELVPNKTCDGGGV